MDAIKKFEVKETKLEKEKLEILPLEEVLRLYEIWAGNLAVSRIYGLPGDLENSLANVQVIRNDLSKKLKINLQ